MARYYFNIRDGNELAPDPEGAEFDTLQKARDEALRSARELLSQRVIRGEIVDGQAFELTSESGEVIDIVKFRDALRLE
jgi:hypothetical protein